MAEERVPPPLDEDVNLFGDDDDDDDDDMFKSAVADPVSTHFSQAYFQQLKTQKHCG